MASTFPLSSAISIHSVPVRSAVQDAGLPKPLTIRLVTADTTLRKVPGPMMNYNIVIRNFMSSTFL